MESEALDSFIDSWGAIGSLLGVNTSVARVHALLIASDRPWSLDEIAERLNISKSNVSMSLKELRSWNVIRRVIQAGERREFYTCEPDVWRMFFNIIRERKKREFDPIVDGVRAALDAAEASPSGIAVDRLKQMEQMLSTFEAITMKLLANETNARTIIAFLLGKS